MLNMAAPIVAADNTNKKPDSMISLLTSRPKTMNHKQWKAYLKKIKRKETRVALAKERDSLLKLNGGEVEDLKTDSEEERQRQEEESERQRQNAMWLERERQSQLQFEAKKEWEEKEKRKKEETERRIREEWEERERKENEDREKIQKIEAERKSKQDKLLKEATANENTDAWHNPIGPVVYNHSQVQERKVDHCPFFKKTAACRFGTQCSRWHEYPETSCTLLLPGMFTSFELEQSVVDNMDTDISLEYDDEDLYQSFREFYDDVVPEFKKLGTILQFKVCCNCEPHLRGNVYVQYKRESMAEAAFHRFQARWYGGKQLNCLLINIESWKSAICGLAFRKRCPKGKSCNFLHVFPNPGREFTALDNDQHLGTDRRFRGLHTDETESRRQRSNHQISRSPSRQSKYRRRSRSRSQSRSPSRQSKRKRRSRTRSQSCSPSRQSKRKRRSRTRSQSRSPSRQSKRKRRSRTRSQSRSPSRQSKRKRRSRSRSPSAPQKGACHQRRSRSRSPSRQSSSRHRSPSHQSQHHHHRRSRSHSPSRHRGPRRRSRSKTGSRSPSYNNRYRQRSRSDTPFSESESRRSSKSKSPSSPQAKKSRSHQSSRTASLVRYDEVGSRPSQSKDHYPHPSSRSRSRSLERSPSGHPMSRTHSQSPPKGLVADKVKGNRKCSRSRSRSNSREIHGRSKGRSRKSRKKDRIRSSRKSDSGNKVNTGSKTRESSSSEGELEFQEITKDTLHLKNK